MTEEFNIFPLHHPTLTLIGDGEAINAGELSRSVELDLSKDVIKGQRHTVILVSSGGNVSKPAGVLYVFDTDPEISLGDSDLDVSDHCRQIAKFEVTVMDWDSSQTAASIVETGEFHFERGDGLWLAFKSMSPFAADEILQVVPRYR